MTYSQEHAQGASPLDTVGQLLSLAALPAAERGVADPVLSSFRRALQSERERRGEQTLAEQRFAAHLAGDYEFVEPHKPGAHGQLPTLRVRFRAGPRSWHEDEFGAVPVGLLRAIVHAIRHDAAFCENLRPHTMPLYSPRVFWSLARIYGRAWVWLW